MPNTASNSDSKTDSETCNWRVSWQEDCQECANWPIQQVSASPESISTRRCESHRLVLMDSGDEAARTGYVDAWRMYKKTLEQIARGSRSRTHVQTQPTSSASCIRESSATRQWAVGNESKSAATRSWSNVSYNAPCRNKNADIRVTTKRWANADAGYTTATCGLDTNAQKHTYQETTSLENGSQLLQQTFWR